MNIVGDEIFPVLIPNWPLPAGVRSAITMRLAGRLEGSSNQEFLLGLPPASSYDSEPSAFECANEPSARTLLARQLELSLTPQWLKQEHGVTVVEASENGGTQVADASFTRRRGLACAVLTADCLPLLVSAKDGSLVGAIHAGWRGLAGGIIANIVRAMRIEPDQLTVYMGPAISLEYFEVGPEVRQRFLDASKGGRLDEGQVHSSPNLVDKCFHPSNTKQGHYFADLYELARMQLEALGITEIYGGEYCTYSQPSLFYSHRRGQDAGRMASLIWREA